jgi:Holliday junction resolvasome RuvABC ATP-dependent DNA helicase subunit
VRVRLTDLYDSAMSSLIADVSGFVDEIGSALGTLSGDGRDAHRQEALIEASNLVGAIIDSDGRQADAELDAFLDAIGPRLQPPLIVTAARLREGGMLDGRRTWLGSPSVLFDLLVRADARDGERRSHRYYAGALRLAHLTAALDLVPSADEIAAIDRFRSALLQAMDAAGINRPGQPQTGPTPPVPGTPNTQRPGTPPTAAAADAPAITVDVHLPPARGIDELLAELDELVGLDNVKAEVRRLTSLLQVQRLREERGLPTIETSKHLVFSGNPGTGKTTVARLLSQIYRAVGVVSTGHLVETDRSKLVAGYVGQTALKTQQTLETSLGGMLLIDEAYALARGGENDFGREAIDTLVKFMEDHRDDLAIVAAGYTEEMNTFIDTNPGLKSRFTRTINFADYTTEQLVLIFLKLGEKHQYTCSDDALARVQQLIDGEPRTRGFGNARFVRNLFETAVAHQAMRIAPLTDPSDEQLTTFTATDIVPVDN